jgi:hypothetical protein
MELWLGPSHHGPAFASEEERRRLWNEHRDRLLRLFGQDGRRPMAWWKYESPVPFPSLRRFPRREQCDHPYAKIRYRTRHTTVTASPNSEARIRTVLVIGRVLGTPIVKTGCRRSLLSEEQLERDREQQADDD